MGRKFNGYNKKVDGNHAEIVRGLKEAGRAVLDLARLGFGAPDLLDSDFSDMWLLEVKDEGGDLNSNQREWLTCWNGKPVVVVRDLAEAIRATTSGRRERFAALVARRLYALIMKAESRIDCVTKRIRKSRPRANP